MATITPVQGTNIGVLQPDGNTAAGGDEFIFTGKPLVIQFANTHTASITVSIAPVLTTTRVPVAGTVNLPTRSLVLAADAVGSFVFTNENAQAYLNTSGRIAVTYTGHNAALKQRAMVI
jgi:hypothetical protein